MIRCEIIVHWSNEDQAFIPEVPELPGCAADGGTYQEAVANGEVVIPAPSHLSRVTMFGTHGHASLLLLRQ